jgi:hypothetical protein
MDSLSAKRAFVINDSEIALKHWEIKKLLEMGVRENLVQAMASDEMKDLLKGLLYLEQWRKDRERDLERGE